MEKEGGPGIAAIGGMPGAGAYPDKKAQIIRHNNIWNIYKHIAKRSMICQSYEIIIYYVRSAIISEEGEGVKISFMILDNINLTFNTKNILPQ